MIQLAYQFFPTGKMIKLYINGKLRKCQIYIIIKSIMQHTVVILHKTQMLFVKQNIQVNHTPRNRRN